MYQQEEEEEEEGKDQKKINKDKREEAMTWDKIPRSQSTLETTFCNRTKTSSIKK